ncbi:MAG: hypothetical protein IT423_16420, partial [Pirellulaceae bacterium]|nr:hypothetical protein [Pirellulaceae bacterium]
GDFWGVYDYQQRSSIEPQTTTWSLNGPMVGWIGPNWMLAGGGIVMDTEVHVPVWKYRSEKWAGAALWQDTVTMIDNSQGLRLRTLPMPHAEMQAAIESRPKLEELLATDHGSAVDLQFELPDPLPANVNREELERRMTEIVKRAGWLLSKEAELKLVVRIAPGKTRQEQYLKYVPNMTSARPEMIEVTPLISRLELRENGQPIWWMEHQNGARSPSYGPSPKEKAEHIKDRERAIPEYFYGIVLPTRIPRQPYTHGMGQSYDHHGLWEAQPIVP